MSRYDGDVLTTEQGSGTDATTTEPAQPTQSDKPLRAEGEPSSTDAASTVSTASTVAPTDPATEVKPEEAAKPEGPTEEEITAAVQGFKYLIEGKPAEGDEPAVPGILEDDGRDTTSGHLSEELKSKVKAAYATLPGGTGKGAARPQVREYIESLVAQGIESMDVGLARTAFIIKTDCLTARGAQGAGVVKAPVDPTEQHVKHIVALFLAAFLVETPEGVEDDWANKANARAAELRPALAEYATWLHNKDENKPEEPDAPEEIKLAGKIATGRGTRTSVPRQKKDGTVGTASTSTRGTYSGPKRDILKHVNEFFAGKPADYVALIGEVAKFSSAEYGTDNPSSGAVSSRVWPLNGGKSNLPGYDQVMKDGKKAVRRAAVVPVQAQPVAAPAA
jgi:hypothetical protein